MKPPPGFREATEWEHAHRHDLYSDGAGGVFVPNGWERYRELPEVERKPNGWGHTVLHVAGWAFILSSLWDIATAMF